ncbi:MAG: hypothetical protein OEZ38_03790, partial [Gammaproteobacteria bacterium]|nr:hypothetical protein [Gammaproteobacteria bacterium]
MADPFPPNWVGGTGGAIHYAPVAWPSEPVNPVDCGQNCGQWIPYTRFQNSVNDARARDDSHGGTTPQNYVNISSSCTDSSSPSTYYYLHQGVTADDDVIMFRWRVEQSAHTYATGPSAGSYSSSSPWSSSLWTVFFDVDGSGFTQLAAHLNGSSGSPAESVDMLAGIWSPDATQSIDYINDANIQLLGHNPTAFVDQATGQILNFQDSVTPVASWPNGSAETSWDYGTTRAKLVSNQGCDEYFIDYQIPVAMLDATAMGGPKITRTTPISMMFCTANSLNNPLQKDCALKNTWLADSSSAGAFGDYISFNKTESYSQPIVAEITAVAPSSCGLNYTLTTRIQDAQAVVNGEVVSSVQAVDFFYWYDSNGNGDADEVDGIWTHAASASQVSGTLNQWTASWDANNLVRGPYLIGVQAIDDNTLVDEDMTPSGIDNRTFSYLVGDAQNEIYIADAWVAGQQAVFQSHSPGQLPGATENWYGNPDVTGLQAALTDAALNTCGVGPVVTQSASNTEVAPGATVTYTITVDNSASPYSVSIDSIVNRLPDGFSYQLSTTTGDFTTADPVISGQTLTWTLGAPLVIAANGSASLDFTATASSNAGTYNNTVTVASSFGDILGDPFAVLVGDAGLSLNIQPGSLSVNPGGQISFTLNYSNPSTVVVNAVSLDSTLPTDTTFASCTGGCTELAGVVSWSLGNLAPGASGSVSLTLDVSAGYTTSNLVLSASLSGTDAASSPVSTSAQASLYVNLGNTSVAQLLIEKSQDTILVAQGNQVIYTLSYVNYGGTDANGVVITDVIPAGMTFVSATGGGVESLGTVTWPIGTVVSGGTGSVTLTLQAGNPFTATNPVVNSAEINWTGAGAPVSSSATLGISGLALECSTYYFRDATVDVGFDGLQRMATESPVPQVADVGASVTVTAPVAGAAFLEAVRFYQDPVAPVDINFAGNIDTTIFIDRPNGPGLDVQATVNDYDPVTGALVPLGQQIFGFGGNSKGQLLLSVPVAGTLQKDHRLLWVIDVRSQHNSQSYSVQVQYNGTVTNAISGGTSFATSNATYCVPPPANLVMNKSVDQLNLPAETASSLVYSITYGNLGASSATNVVIVDTLPSNINFVDATNNGLPIIPVVAGNVYTFTIGTVTAATSGELIINTTVPVTTSGTLSNSVAMSSDQTGTLNDTAITTIGTNGGATTSPQVFLSKTADLSAVGASTTVTYTLTLVNAGTETARNIVVTDDFPEQAYFAYLGCLTASGSCSETPAGVLSWLTGNLAAGASATLTYQMQTSATGIPNGVTILSNTASAIDDVYCSGGTPPASCSSDAVAIAISGNPDLAVTLAADNLAVIPGDQIQYTMTVSNNGSSTANELSIVNPVPAYTGFNAITAGTGSFDNINNRVIFNTASLAAGANQVYSFTVDVDSPLPSGNTLITDTVTVTAANAVSVSDSVTSTATAAPVMSVSITGTTSVPTPATTLAADATATTVLNVSSASLLNAGDTIRVNGVYAQVTAINGNFVTVNSAITATSGSVVDLAARYSVIYQNSGNADATNVQISETLPAGWLYVSSSPAATSAPAVGANGSLSWSLGTVAAGDS